MEVILARYRARCSEIDRLRDSVRAVLPGLLAMLVSEFGARRVILFGSLVGGLPSWAPDVDLLVEGVPLARIPDAQARCFLLAPLPVDLVPIESGRAEVVRRGLETGEVLYDGR